MTDLFNDSPVRPVQPPDTPDGPILIWLDLETTGLEPDGGEILELAMFATDLAGNKIGEPFEAVFQYQRDDVLLKMDDYVLDMHLSSGLLKRVWDDDILERVRGRNRAKWGQVQRWFNRLPGKPKHRHLAGNSIHFDRMWLQVKQPDLLKSFSHRMLDVSAMLIVVPTAREDRKVVEHRALADAKASFDTYRNIFLPLLRPDVSPV